MTPRPAIAALTRCRLCGATNYRRVVGRDGAGAIRATSVYQCSGCAVTFLDPKVWRGATAQPDSLAPESTRAGD